MIAAANEISDRPYLLRPLPDPPRQPDLRLLLVDLARALGRRPLRPRPVGLGPAHALRAARPRPLGRRSTPTRGHVFLYVAGLRMDTGRYDTGPNAGESGPRWRLGPRPLAGFAVTTPARPMTPRRGHGASLRARASVAAPARPRTPTTADRHGLSPTAATTTGQDRRRGAGPDGELPGTAPAALRERTDALPRRAGRHRAASAAARRSAVWQLDERDRRRGDSGGSRRSSVGEARAELTPGRRRGRADDQQRGARVPSARSKRSSCAATGRSAAALVVTRERSSQAPSCRPQGSRYRVTRATRRAPRRAAGCSRDGSRSPKRSRRQSCTGARRSGPATTRRSAFCRGAAARSSPSAGWSAAPAPRTLAYLLARQAARESSAAGAAGRAKRSRWPRRARGQARHAARLARARPRNDAQSSVLSPFVALAGGLRTGRRRPTTARGPGRVSETRSRGCSTTRELPRPRRARLPARSPTPTTPVLRALACTSCGPPGDRRGARAGRAPAAAGAARSAARATRRPGGGRDPAQAARVLRRSSARLAERHADRLMLVPTSPLPPPTAAQRVDDELGHVSRSSDFPAERPRERTRGTGSSAGPAAAPRRRLRDGVSALSVAVTRRSGGRRPARPAPRLPRRGRTQRSRSPQPTCDSRYTAAGRTLLAVRRLPRACDPSRRPARRLLAFEPGRDRPRVGRLRDAHCCESSLPTRRSSWPGSRSRAAPTSPRAATTGALPRCSPRRLSWSRCSSWRALVESFLYFGVPL